MYHNYCSPVTVEINFSLMREKKLKFAIAFNELSIRIKIPIMAAISIPYE